GGVATRPGARGTWRVERGYRDLLQTIDISERIARAAGTEEIARWAVLTAGLKFAFQPASHLRTSMIVPIVNDDAVIEEEIVVAAAKRRKEKNLWTHSAAGVPVTVHEAYNEEDDALYVLREIERLHKSQKVP